ncbi:MAG: hypothetical protein CVV58_02010 [Tenericutes bacterium HGW-Tenericutes-3]|nr:MAG: hypothetical protein CVV58_02010 [Tenericutes bacterium HGW-Tenericutes-3]
MRQKKLVIGLLVMLSLLVSGFTYAYWAAGIAADSETAVGTISVGTGETVTSTVNVAAAVNSQGSDDLVPAGFAATGKITSLTLTFSVDWDSTGLDASGLSSTLTVALTGATNGTPAQDAAVLALLNAAFNGAGDGTYTVISDGSAVSVVITITMDEPANQTEYGYVAGQDLDLTFSFSVAAAS